MYWPDIFRSCELIYMYWPDTDTDVRIGAVLMFFFCITWYIRSCDTHRPMESLGLLLPLPMHVR